MLIIAGNKKIHLSKRAVETISKEFNPENFLYVLDMGIALMIVYEESFCELNRIFYGFLYYPYDEREGELATMNMDHRTFSLEDKKKALQHYLGIAPENEEDINKLFDELVWLKESLEEPLEISEDELF